MFLNRFLRYSNPDPASLFDDFNTSLAACVKFGEAACDFVTSSGKARGQEHKLGTSHWPCWVMKNGVHYADKECVPQKVGFKVQINIIHAVAPEALKQYPGTAYMNDSIFPDALSVKQV